MSNDTDTPTYSAEEARSLILGSKDRKMKMMSSDVEHLMETAFDQAKFAKLCNEYIDVVSQPSEVNMIVGNIPKQIKIELGLIAPDVGSSSSHEYDDATCEEVEPEEDESKLSIVTSTPKKNISMKLNQTTDKDKTLYQNLPPVTIPSFSNEISHHQVRMHSALWVIYDEFNQAVVDEITGATKKDDIVKFGFSLASFQYFVQTLASGSIEQMFQILQSNEYMRSIMGVEQISDQLTSIQEKYEKNVKLMSQQEEQAGIKMAELTDEIAKLRRQVHESDTKLEEYRIQIDQQYKQMAYMLNERPEDRVRVDEEEDLAKSSTSSAKSSYQPIKTKQVDLKWGSMSMKDKKLWLIEAGFNQMEVSDIMYSSNRNAKTQILKKKSNINFII